MSDRLAVGGKIRALRRQQHLTQADLAQRVGVSASYLNLIEHNRRTLGANLLIRLAEVLPIDLKTFSPDHEGQTVTELLEVFGDPMFESLDVITQDVKELATVYPAVSHAIVRLYGSFRAARQSTQDLAESLTEEAAKSDAQLARSPSEEVSDLIQRHMNFFPELEYGAEALVLDAKLDSESLFAGLVRYLKRVSGVEVRVEQTRSMQSAVRSYDPDRKVLMLSEVLRRGSRNFQLAYQV